MSDPVLPWLTPEQLSGWLGREVTGLTLSTAVPPGNNYGSVVTRVKAQLKDQDTELSLIIKSELTEGAIKDNFFIATTIEHDFYYKFLPEAQKITSTPFAPEAFPITRPESVILEDLCVRGFKMADRRKQLDFEHCRLYMLAAAEFHAVSWAVYKNHPDLIESIGEEKFYTGKNEINFKKMVEGGIKCLVNKARKHARFERVCRIIEQAQDHLMGMIKDAHQRRKDFNVINQGDAWITNMMFRYNENGAVEDVKIIDFQMLRFASPVNDLVFFVWSSADNDVKTSRLPELYKIYLESFNKNLKKCGCTEVFSEEDFMENVRRLSPQALLIMASFLPLVLNPEPIDADMFYKDDNVKYYEMYYDENFCKNYLYQSIEQLEQAGVFDYLENYLENLIR